jgi:hypothetical protein
MTGKEIAVILPLAVAGLMLTVGCKSSATPIRQRAAGMLLLPPVAPNQRTPYDEGSGHYAGYEWAQERGSGTCGGNSQSFVEGCEEYESQEAEYQECEARK